MPRWCLLPNRCSVKDRRWPSQEINQAPEGKISLYAESSSNKPGPIVRARSLPLTVMEENYNPVAGYIWCEPTKAPSVGYRKAASLEVLIFQRFLIRPTPDQTYSRLFRRDRCVIIHPVLYPITILHNRDDSMATLAAMIFDFDGVIADTEPLIFPASVKRWLKSISG